MEIICRNKLLKLFLSEPLGRICRGFLVRLLPGSTGVDHLQQTTNTCWPVLKQPIPLGRLLKAPDGGKYGLALLGATCPHSTQAIPRLPTSLQFSSLSSNNIMSVYATPEFLRSPPN